VKLQYSGKDGARRLSYSVLCRKEQNRFGSNNIKSD